MITFQNISKKYKHNVVLKNINLSIEKGKIISIIGESGCGKTTLLKIINGLITPTSGSVYVNSKDIKQQDIVDLRRHMGYVIQQTGLFPHMTVKENIEIIPKVLKYNKEEITSKTIELLEMVGLDEQTNLNKYPDQLSGGQQQRIGVARAFACNPEIILMDEPFSALDPITRSDLQDQLLELQSIFNKTIVFVTHDMDEAIKISDYICIMKDGEILQFDSPENILKNPIDDYVSDFVGKNRIWASPEFITVKDIMIDNPITTTKDAPIFKCLEKMRQKHVDSLLVIEPTSKKLLGVVKSTQLQYLDEKNNSIETHIKTGFTTVEETQNVLDIINIIKDQKNIMLPVINNKKRLTGLVTKSSLVTTLSKQYINYEGIE